MRVLLLALVVGLVAAPVAFVPTAAATRCWETSDGGIQCDQGLNICVSIGCAHDKLHALVLDKL